MSPSPEPTRWHGRENLGYSGWFPPYSLATYNRDWFASGLGLGSWGTDQFSVPTFWGEAYHLRVTTPMGPRGGMLPLSPPASLDAHVGRQDITTKAYQINRLCIDYVTKS